MGTNSWFNQLWSGLQGHMATFTPDDNFGSISQMSDYEINRQLVIHKLPKSRTVAVQ